MNKQEAIRILGDTNLCSPLGQAAFVGIEAIKKQIPKNVYHFLEDDTFESTCCGIDVTNKDYNFCPNCGCKLGEVEEVEEIG